MNRKLIFLLMMLVGSVQAAESESFQVLKQRIEALEKKLETTEAPRKKSSLYFPWLIDVTRNQIEDDDFIANSFTSAFRGKEV